MNPAPESHPDETRPGTEERPLAAAERSIMAELAAFVFNEFNQPLTNIAINGSACLRFLAGDAPDIDQAREALEEIVRDARRACEAFFHIQALTKGNSLPKDNLSHAIPASGT